MSVILSIVSDLLFFAVFMVSYSKIEKNFYPKRVFAKVGMIYVVLRLLTVDFSDITRIFLTIVFYGVVLYLVDKKITVVSFVLSIVMKYFLFIVCLILALLMDYALYYIGLRLNYSFFVLLSTTIISVNFFRLVRKNKIKLHVLGELLEVPLIKRITASITVLFVSLWTFIDRSVNLGFSDDATFELLLIALSIVILLVITFLSLIVINHVKIEEKEKKRIENEQETLKLYTDAIEKQYNDVRVFKHDFSNIFLSVESYLLEKDFEGLMKYYFNDIKPETTPILSDYYELENLRKIKISSIKGIFAVKLSSAIKEGVTVEFAVNEEINEVKMSHFLLVRVLGILIDNAMEALTDLEIKDLKVSVIKEANNVTFKIQNNCLRDIPPISKLKKKGFSTKGENRGIGLAFITDVVRENPNISLLTEVENGQFVQEFSVGE